MFSSKLDEGEASKPQHAVVFVIPQAVGGTAAEKCYPCKDMFR